jgi:hypothetical protein
MSTSVVTVKNQQILKEFDSPEFFENGVIISVTDGEKTIEIHRDGQALAFYRRPGTEGEAEILADPSHFRDAFPDGKLPEVRVEWRMNAWFDLYDGEGNHLDVVGFELRDMIQTVMSKFGVTVS